MNQEARGKDSITQEWFHRVITDIASFMAGRAPVWLVGGAVRDYMMGRIPADIDLVVVGEQALAPVLAGLLGASLVQLSAPHGLYRLVCTEKDQPTHVDVEFIDSADIAANLGRRDFTVDAMALPLKPYGLNKEELVDPYRGMTDLEKRLIRAVNSSVFEDDPVRALRAFRLASALNFEINTTTLEQMKLMRRSFEDVAGERVWIEFSAILTMDVATRVLRKMEVEAGLVTRLIPELALLKGLGQGKWHVLDAWDHTMLALEWLERILCSARDDELHGVRLIYDKAILEWPKCVTPALKLGLLMHDVGKPTAAAVAGRECSFPGHEREGPLVAKRLCERWRLPGWERDIVLAIVEGHMHPLYLYQEGNFTPKPVRRFFNRRGRYVPFLLLGSLADVVATRTAAGNSHEAALYRQFITGLLEMFVNEGAVWKKLPRFLNGNEVMKILEIKPSPLVGQVLAAITEAEIAGEITSKEEAETFVRERRYLPYLPQ